MATPFLGWLGLPIINPVFSWAVTFALSKWVYTPIREEITLREIARQNFVNQQEFERAFLKVKLVENTADIETRRKVIQDAFSALDNLALYRIAA